MRGPLDLLPGLNNPTPYPGGLKVLSLEFLEKKKKFYKKKVSHHVL